MIMIIMIMIIICLRRRRRMIMMIVGAFYFLYRFDVGIRRIGTGLFAHGLTALLCAAGYINPALRIIV